MKPTAPLGVVALGIGFGGSAAAADIGIQTEPPSPAVANNWSGPYLGVNLGGAWQSAPSWTYFNPNNGARFSLSSPGNWGVLGGVQGGYDWQSARWFSASRAMSRGRLSVKPGRSPQSASGASPE